MDSSHYNPTYGQWNAAFSSQTPSPLLPPPPPLLYPPRQSHPESLNFHGRLSQSVGQRQDYHHYSHRQDLPPKPAVNQAPSYYSQHPPTPPLQPQHPSPLPQQHPSPLPQQHLQYIPQQVNYDSQRISRPSSNTIPCTESQNIVQSAWVGYKEKRHDSWTVDAGRSRVNAGPGRNNLYDYSCSSRDFSGVSNNRGLEGTSRSRDEFRNLGYEKKESGATRIDRNYQVRGHLESESGRYFRGFDEGYMGLSSKVGCGSARLGVTVNRDVTRSSASYDGARNQRCDEAHNGGRTLYPRKKDDYYHPEIEQYIDHGRREESNESNRTPRKQIQKKSALLRLENPRSYQNGRNNDCSGKRFNSNSFRGKEHFGNSDRGLVEKQRVRTPVELDVSFKSNVLIAKPVALLKSIGIRPDVSLTPRSSKARRALVTDKNEKASVTEENGKLRIYFSDEASASEVSRESARQNTAYEIEKKPDNHSTPPSSDSGGKLNRVRFSDGVVQDIKVKITDSSPESSIHDCEAKVRSTVHAAEKMSSFREAMEEAKDDINVKRDSNMESCSTEEDVIDGDKSIVKAHEDVSDKKGTGCNAGETLIPKVIEKEEIMKSHVSWRTAANLSECSKRGIHFAVKAMCRGESQPCEDEDIDCIPSPMMDVSTDLEEKKYVGSAIGYLGSEEKDFENVESLSPENDSSRGHPKSLVSSAFMSVANASTDLANANNSVSGDLANSYTAGIYTNTLVNSPDMSAVLQVESKNLPHCENTANPSVENVSREELMEIMHLDSAAEMADNLDSDEGKQTCINSTFSSLTMAAVKQSSNVLPIERTDGCSCSDESDLAMAVPSECVENASTERLVPNEDLGLASHRPSEIPFVMVDESSKGKEKTKPSGGTVKYRIPGSDIAAVSGDSLFPCDSLSNSPRVCGETRSETKVAPMVNDKKYTEKTKPSVGTSKYQTPETDIIAVSGDSVFPCDSLSSPPRLSFRKMRSGIQVGAMVDETSKVKESQKGSILLDTLQEQIMTSHEVTQPGSSLAHYPCLGQTCPGTDVDSYALWKYNGSDLVEKPNGDPMEKLIDVRFDVASQEKYSPNSSKTDIFDCEALSSDGKVSGTEIPGDLGIRVPRSHSHLDVKGALTHVKDHVASVPHRGSQSKTSMSSSYEIERKKRSNYSTQKTYPRSLPFVSGTKRDANTPTHITKRHTWHRKSDSSPSSFIAAKPMTSTLSAQQKFTNVAAQSSNSYVRKGNSLLRKPSHSSRGVAFRMPPSAIQWNRFSTEDKSTGSASMVDVNNSSFHVKTGEIFTLEKQSKPPSDSSTSKVSNAIATSSGKCALSYSMDHLTTSLPESIMDSATSGEANVSNSGRDTFKKSDTLIKTGYASDCQQIGNMTKLDSSNLKKTVYVKKKANQLVAASDIHYSSKRQIPPSDGYFKRSKNQLVRNLGSHVNQSISLPDDAIGSQAAANTVSERSSSSALSDSAVGRPFNQSKCSLVWTHNDPHPKMPIAHMRYQKILPQLVPWKKVTYCRRLMNSVSAFRNGSFSNISGKLSMMRKRHTVYTRSTNGYSLRKSKVLSIGGSHLKWSKSIERNSRKANEEATLAVAAFAKKESEKHYGQSNTRMTSRNHLARKRVFRFGSLRYKMDSSRRILQRISDVDRAGPSENGKDAKRPFIPKRLVIDNEEYVRVGNGNQLVRDPKKRTRVLANEKVRWSLHNVRLRLAKKKKYCQFFTRFGKCNKDNGKCPYVHDPSKIAVCTKFLNGSCTNPNCKLTHKVIPERMPDCSYFLQGLCNNKVCPYRHVHVNPSAAICDGFLKGYCSDGDECRKKHSYICPVFEATGSCSQGLKCKLHHPKNQSKGEKRKRPTEWSEPSQKNSRGRYFGSFHKVVHESEPMVVDRSFTDSEGFGMEGLDFINLSATENETGVKNDSGAEESSSGDSEAPVSIYDIIRPVALMQ